jgi:hypothetical protein
MVDLTHKLEECDMETSRTKVVFRLRLRDVLQAKGVDPEDFLFESGVGTHEFMHFLAIFKEVHAENSRTWSLVHKPQTV